MMRAPLFLLANLIGICFGTGVDEKISCDPNPCQNNGDCFETGKGIQCLCKGPYKGHFCDEGPCIPNPCQNGGSCAVTDDTFEFNCSCAAGYTGETCANEISCDPNPCQNNGDCFETGKGIQCLCKESYKGHFCDEGPCNPNPCKNGGSCAIREDILEFNCSCAAGFTGETCGDNITAPASKTTFQETSSPSKITEVIISTSETTFEETSPSHSSKITSATVPSSETTSQNTFSSYDVATTYQNSYLNTNKVQKSASSFDIFNITLTPFISKASYSDITSAVNNITETFTTSTDSSTISESASLSSKTITIGQGTSTNIYTLSPVENSASTFGDGTRNESTLISTSSESGMISTVDIISRTMDIRTEPFITSDVTSSASGTSTEQSSEVNNLTKTSSQSTWDELEIKSSPSTITKKPMIVTSVYRSSEATTEMSNYTKEGTDSANEDVTKSSAWSTKTAAPYIGIGIAGLLALVSLITFGWYRKRKCKRRTQQYVDYASSETSEGSNESHNDLV